MKECRVPSKEKPQIMLITQKKEVEIEADAQLAASEKVQTRRYMW